MLEATLDKNSCNFFCSSLLLTWWDTQDAIETLVHSSLVHTAMYLPLSWSVGLFLQPYFSPIILKWVGIKWSRQRRVKFAFTRFSGYYEKSYPRSLETRRVKFGYLSKLKCFISLVSLWHFALYFGYLVSCIFKHYTLFITSMKILFLFRKKVLS